MLQWGLCFLNVKAPSDFASCGVRELYCTRFGSNLQLACCSSSLSRVWSPTADNRRSLALLYPSHELHGSQLLPGSSESDLWLYTQNTPPFTILSNMDRVCAGVKYTTTSLREKLGTFLSRSLNRNRVVPVRLCSLVFIMLANFLETKWRLASERMFTYIVI